jgi:TM2 domain-containing membrane protein YozV
MNNKPKHKTIATYITLFFGIFGMHYFYLNKTKKFAFIHIIATALFILGFVLFQYSQTSILVWSLLSIGVINWCSVWLTAIIYGLMQEQKWLNYTNNINSNQNISLNIQDIKYAKTNGLTVLCIIIALMLGMGSLMAFLSFAIQSYYL